MSEDFLGRVRAPGSPRCAPAGRRRLRGVDPGRDRSEDAAGRWRGARSTSRSTGSRPKVSSASERGDPTPIRGGRAKRYFRLKPRGLRLLKRTLADLDRLQEGLAAASRGSMKPESRRASRSRSSIALFPAAVREEIVGDLLEDYERHGRIPALDPFARLSPSPGRTGSAGHERPGRSSTIFVREFGRFGAGRRSRSSPARSSRSASARTRR